MREAGIKGGGCRGRRTGLGLAGGFVGGAGQALLCLVEGGLGGVWGLWGRGG